jgi:hypothetical protein
LIYYTLEKLFFDFFPTALLRALQYVSLARELNLILEEIYISFSAKRVTAISSHKLRYLMLVITYFALLCFLYFPYNPAGLPIM